MMARVSDGRWVIHADLDAFFAAAEVLRRPELAGTPVIVGGSPEGRGVVSSATYEARAFGVRSAMPVAQAIRLCPDAILVRPDFDYYRALSDRFRAIMDAFSPVVEVVSIDEAYLDVSHSDRLFGEIGMLARSLKDRVRVELGLAVSLGVASNKLVAKIASDLDKPDGLRIVPHGDESATLAPLSVDRMPGIGPKAAARLRTAGVETLGQLASLSEIILREVGGNDTDRLRRRAQGEDDRPVRSERDARKSLGHEHTFDRDRFGFNELEEPLYWLSEKTGAELRRSGLAATTVTLKLRYADFSTVSRQMGTARPTDAHQEIHRVARGLLERALRERMSPVRLIGVRVTGLTVGAHQLELGVLDSGQRRLRQINAVIDTLGTGVVVPARFSGRPSRPSSTPRSSPERARV